MNRSIHGIGPDDVRGSPTFQTLLPRLADKLRHELVVSHTAFDRSAIRRAAERCHASLPPMEWLDTCEVARRSWPERSEKGFGLKVVCDLIGHRFQHHDALADAKAVAHVLLAALQKTGLSLDEMQAHVRQPVRRITASSAPEAAKPRATAGRGTLVFTGRLSIARREAAARAKSVGWDVADYVNRNTTFLIIGDVDARQHRGAGKSSKHLAAEGYIQRGAPVRIITESDFLSLIE